MDTTVMYGIGVLSILNLFFLITSIFYWITFTKLSKNQVEDATNTLQYVNSTPTSYDYTVAGIHLDDGDNYKVELSNALDYKTTGATKAKTLFIS